MKFQNPTGQGVRCPPRSDAHDLDQIRTFLLLHLRGSHEHQLLQGCNFLILRGFEQTNPKIPIIETCFERPDKNLPKGKELVLDARLPLKIRFAKLMKLAYPD